MATTSKAFSPALRMLEQEARALLSRLARVKPFALQETMVAAAAVPLAAQKSIERYLLAGRIELRQRIRNFLKWIKSQEGLQSSPAQAQRRFSMIKLRFNAAITHFDIFSDALTQRSESDTGVWLAGLDIASADALSLPDAYYEVPPVICYLDRGHGAAIRRARTRLPGGGENPVAVIRVPRERMVGSGIASSLIHEVGHQATALLDLIESIRPVLKNRHGSGDESIAWEYWDRCISEILADFWSVARLGLTSTIGLIGVVSLPRYFVFRLNFNDPHPVPWIRVRLSCAMGRALYPHSQWDTIENNWLSYYPWEYIEPEKRSMFVLLERTMPELAAVIASHRPAALRGASLKEVLKTDTRQPAQLSALFKSWRAAPDQMYKASPTLVFAVLGQARAEEAITPEAESRTLAGMLKYWALYSTLNSTSNCAGPSDGQPHHRFYSLQIKEAI